MTARTVAPSAPGLGELVVLLDPDRRPIGTAPKRSVHSDRTPLHLAFSCWLFDDAGRVLVTRRALTKTAWPGVWTNAYCGHPAPGEAMVDAVIRRGAQELGATVGNVSLVLPDFAYRAVDASGVVEHEVCPVHVATLDTALDPAPDEVMDLRWTEPDRLLAAIAAAPFAFSPWVVEQAPLLAAARPDLFARA